MSKAQRDKGHNYEREIARLFREIYPDSARHLEYQKDEAKKGVDVVAGPFVIQCKNTAKFVPAKTLFDVQADAGQIPLLVCRDGRRGCESLVVFDRSVFSLSGIRNMFLQNPNIYPSLNNVYQKLAKARKQQEGIWGIEIHHYLAHRVLSVMLLPDFLQILRKGAKQNDPTS